jgi:hypothetical protein
MLSVVFGEDFPATEDAVAIDRIEFAKSRPTSRLSARAAIFSRHSHGLKQNRPLDWSGQFDLLVASNFPFRALQRLG